MKTLSDINKKHNRKQELERYLKNKKYPDYIKTLEEMVSDPKTKALVEEGFGGDLGDIQLKFSEKTISVKRLLPTQNEISLESSLKHCLINKETISKFLDGEGIVTKFPLVTFNENYVIDGHHRWSEVFIVNPKAKMVCVNYNGDMSPIQMLKATQGAIAASTGDVPESKRKGQDIYSVDEDNIRKYIDETITDDVIDIFVNKIFDIDNKEDVVDYLVDNCLQLKNDYPPIKYAPDRELMPQTDTAGTPKDKGSALNRMKKDKVLKI